ncbi:MAG: hypothetical protein GY749_43985 [Desulfobacteraceae bacterium]|nr:hypothetical protein [Desulfobacteraceae bacterium]
MKYIHNIKLSHIFFLSIITLLLFSSEIAAQINPTISMVSPTSGTRDGGTLVTITGNNLRSTQGTVTFGGQQAPIRTWTESQIVCITPAYSKAESVILVVTTSDGKTPCMAFCPMYFNYTSGQNDISVESISPSSGTTSGGQVTITGQNFGSNPGTVTFGGIGASSYITWENTKIICITPQFSPGGKVDVTITNQSGQSITKALMYEYILNPVIYGATPLTGSRDGGTPVTVTGKDFGNNKGTITFGGRYANVTSWSYNKIICLSPAYNTAQSVDLRVVTSDGKYAFKSNAFEYTAGSSDAVIDKIFPMNDLMKGGQSITISGRNFYQPVTVEFDGRKAEVEQTYTTQIVCKSPDYSDFQTKKEVSVKVTNAYGGSYTYTQKFTYDTLPWAMFHPDYLPESVTEDSEITLRIYISPASDSELEIPITTGGNAQKGVDYSLPDFVGNTVSVQDYRDIRISARSDNDQENDDVNLILTLNNINNVIKGDSTHSVNITDNDISVGPGKTFDTIQDAIDAANEGDTIYVQSKNTPYEENLIVNKAGIIIKSSNKAEIMGSQNRPVVSIARMNVTLNGFIIYCSPSIDDTGISIVAADNCTITDNEIKSTTVGMYIASNNNKILNNSFNSIDQNNIFLNASGHNIICNNTFAPANQRQLYAYASSDNIISNNAFSNDNQSNTNSTSIHLDYSHRNMISNNTDITVIQIAKSSHNFFRENKLRLYNTGIKLLESNCNVFSNNYLTSANVNNISVYLSDSDSNSFYRNIFESDFYGDISISYSDANMFCLNEIPSGGIQSKGHYPNIWNMRAYYKYNNQSATENWLGNFHRGHSDTSDKDGVINTGNLLPTAEPDGEEPEEYYNLAVSPARYSSDSPYYSSDSPYYSSDSLYTIPSAYWLNSDNKMYEDDVYFKLTEQALDSLESEGVAVDKLNNLKNVEYEKEDIFLSALDDLEDETTIAQYKWLILKYAYVRKPASILLNATETAIWVANQGGESYSGCAGQIVADSTHIVTSAETDIRIDIGSSDINGNGYTSFNLPPTYIKIDGGSPEAILFEIDTPFSVPALKYLAVKVMNTSTTTPYSILTGQWSYVSLGDLSSLEGIVSVTPDDGNFKAGQEITITGNKFGDEEGTVRFGTISAGYNTSVNNPYKEWNDDKIVCIAPAFDHGVSVFISVETTNGDNFVYNNGFQYAGPWVSFKQESQNATEGNSVSVAVRTEDGNGEYNVTVPFTVEGTSNSHNLKNGNINVPAGSSIGQVTFIVYDDNEPCKDPGTVILRMGESIINAVTKDTSYTHTVNIQNDETCVSGVSGKIIFKSGDNIYSVKNATIVYTNANNPSITGEVTSGTDGTFELDLESGTYSFTVTEDNTFGTMTINNVVVSESQKIIPNIEMTLFCDHDQDNKIELQDIVYGLQVLSGIRK